MSIVSVLRIRVAPGSEDALAEAYRSLDIFELARASGGFRAGRLLRPVAAGDPFLVVAEWDDAAAYERWLQNPVRAELGTRLEPLLAGPLDGAVYAEVVSA
jgi:heme-degrading monooxygenase HmoA